MPDATALVTGPSGIEWVGPDAVAAGYQDQVDEVVELGGALVTPVFVDAHVHCTATGLALSGLDLSGARSLRQALDAVAAFVGRSVVSPAVPASTVVFGQGWDESGWPEGRAPTQAEVDRAAGGARVYLGRADGHSAVVSSALLAAAGGLAGAAGCRADGLLTQQAHHVVRDAARAAVGPEQVRAAQRVALAQAASVGVGAVHECGGPVIGGEADFVSLLELAAAEPGVEVYGYWGELGGARRARELGAVGAGGDLFCDGSLGSRTAFLREPYLDDPRTRGARYLDAGQIAEHLVECTRAGMVAGFHAIGDGALDEVVEGFSRAVEVTGLAALASVGHRVEHVEMAETEHLMALARYGVTASVQPAFDAVWGGPAGMYARRLGRERAGRMNPFADLAAAGVVLAFGSDSPVTPLDPWGAVAAAVGHREPAHRLSARAAFTAHTRGGWRALGAAGRGRLGSGRLVVGEPASYAVWEAGELVVRASDERVRVWSTDPRSGVPGLPDVVAGQAPRCLRTVVRGRVVFSAGLG